MKIHCSMQVDLSIYFFFIVVYACVCYVLVDNLAAEVETLNDYLQIIVKREMDKKEGSM